MAGVTVNESAILTIKFKLYNSGFREEKRNVGFTVERVGVYRTQVK